MQSFCPMTFVVCTSCQLLFFGSLYCKQYGLRSDCKHSDQCSSVCFQDKILSKVNLNISAADIKCRLHFQARDKGS